MIQITYSQRGSVLETALICNRDTDKYHMASNTAVTIVSHPKQHSIIQWVQA
jgi:hypothetical protein